MKRVKLSKTIIKRIFVMILAIATFMTSMPIDSWGTVVYAAEADESGGSAAGAAETEAPPPSDEPSIWDGESETKPKKGEDGFYQIRFPHSCVLYLRGDNPKDCMNLKLVFPDGQSVNYKVPVLRMQWYSLEELLEKNLVMLLPFYIIRYEKLREQLEIDGTLRKELYTEYRAIERYLEKIFLQKGQEKSFRDMMELINRITGYIFLKSKKIKEGLGEIMGGQVLELESDKLIKRGVEKGVIEKLAELVAKRMRKGDTPEQIAELLEEDKQLIQKIYTVIQENGIDCEPSVISEKVLEK